MHQHRSAALPCTVHTSSRGWAVIARSRRRSLKPTLQRNSRSGGCCHTSLTSHMAPLGLCQLSCSQHSCGQHSCSCPAPPGPPLFPALQPSQGLGALSHTHRERALVPPPPPPPPAPGLPPVPALPPTALLTVRFRRSATVQKPECISLDLFFCSGSKCQR